MPPKVEALQGVPWRSAQQRSHVLPTGIQRIRHSGVLAAACKGKRLDAARCDLQMPQPDPRATESARDFLKRLARIDALQCPCCQGGRLSCMQIEAAPRYLPAPGEGCQHNRGPS